MRRSLTKTEIIRKKTEINRIFNEGTSCSSSGMRLISLKNNLGYDRIIVIPAKHFGRAVDRNLVRRRAKEVFRNYKGRNYGPDCKDKSKDYVLVMYPGKVSDFSLLESGLIKLLDRSNQK
jgi:ribonuclease P protein component